jgi:mono/diheme cytochrome c family protein
MCASIKTSFATFKILKAAQANSFRLSTIPARIGFSAPVRRALPTRRWQWCLMCLLLCSSLFLLGCDKADVPASAPASAAVGSAPIPTTDAAAAQATAYRKGLCRSMSESMSRLAIHTSPEEAAADLSSVRFILNNMLGAFPATSIGPGSNLKPEALDQPQQVAALRAQAVQAVQGMEIAKDTNEFARARTALGTSCMACHGALTKGPVQASAPVR